MGVRAIGVDIVDVGRFAATLGANARLAGRLFTPAERVLPPRSLAARFAAKEAVAKALGSPGGLRWHDCEVVREPNGAPRLVLRGTVAAAALELDKPLAVLPAGTFNHFAKDVGNHPLDRALAAIKAGTAKKVDVAYLNDKLFLNTASAAPTPTS